jgi:hypothetical protein
MEALGKKPVTEGTAERNQKARKPLDQDEQDKRGSDVVDGEPSVAADA